MSQNAEAADTADLGLSTPAVSDQQWARTQPMFIQATKQRIDLKHQVVSIQNTSDSVIGPQGRIVPQKHVVIDRFNQGHELAPGEIKHNIDMLADDIAYFVRERRPDRVNHLGQRKPIHPIKIIGIDPATVPAEPAKPTLSMPKAKEA